MLCISATSSLVMILMTYLLLYEVWNRAPLRPWASLGIGALRVREFCHERKEQWRILHCQACIKQPQWNSEKPLALLLDCSLLWACTVWPLPLLNLITSWNTLAQFAHLDGKAFCLAFLQQQKKNEPEHLAVQKDRSQRVCFIMAFFLPATAPELRCHLL